MTWTQNIARWRSLSAERKLQIRRDAIPLDVAQSMAFEREPSRAAEARSTAAGSPHGRDERGARASQPVPMEKIREIVSMLSPFQGSPSGLTVSPSLALAQITPPALLKPRSAP